MANINNRRFASTVASGTSGTTFVSTLGSFGSSDVGRCIVISQQSSPAFGQIRKIVSRISGTTVTVDYPWDVSPFRAERTGDGSLVPAVVEVNPTIGDSFIVSTSLAELAAANADVVVVPSVNKSYRVTGVITSTDGTFVYDNNCTFEFDLRTNFRMTTGTSGFSCWRFGDISPGTNVNANGYTSNTCRIIDTSTTLLADSVTYNAHFHMYGGTVRVTNPNNATFWRFNTHNTTSPTAAQSSARDRQIFRMYQTQLTGSFGARVAGDKSILLDVAASGGRTTIGPFNPVAVGLVKNLSAGDCNQALYHYGPFAGDVTVSGLTFDDIYDRVIRIDYQGYSGNATSTNNTLTLENFDVNAANALKVAYPAQTFAAVNAGSSSNRILIQQDFKISLQNATLQPFTNPTRLVVADRNGSIVSTTMSNTTSGEFETVSLEYGRVATSSSSVELANFTLRAPYTYHVFSDNSAFIGANETLTTPGVDITYTVVADTNITESNVATVSAYTTLDTAARLYDYQWRFKGDNLALPSLTGFFFRRSGDEVIAETDFDVTFVTNFGFPLLFTGGTLRVAVSDGGYTSGINVGSTNDVTFDNTIRGSVTARNIFHNFTSGTIIDTSGAITGTITLPPGSYIINGAAVGGLVINRQGSAGAVDVTVSNTTGTATANTGVTISAPTVAPTRVRVALSNQPSGARYALWRGFAATGFPSLFGTVLEGSEITMTSANNDETIDGVSYVADDNTVGDYVLGVASITGATTFTGFTVVANTIISTSDETVVVVTPAGPADQSANINTTVDITGRSIAVLSTLSSNRMQFDVNNCQRGNEPTAAQCQRMMAESRQASDNFLTLIIGFVPDLTDGGVISLDVMQFADGGVNMSGSSVSEDGPAQFPRYVFVDNVTGNQQFLEGVYDSGGSSFIPRATENESTNVMTTNQSGDDAAVVSTKRRIGVTLGQVGTLLDASTSDNTGATQTQVQTIVNNAQNALVGHIYGAS